MQDKKRILIVEDEPKIAQILVDFFRMDGFETSVLHDGLHAVDEIRNNEPTAVILDLMLPHKDGIAICREVRTFSNVPILMLTARVDEIDRLTGLGIGADDYVCKPFSVQEVVARVKVILRRFEQPVPTTSSLIGYKHVQMDLDKFVCYVDGNQIELTPVEFRLLTALINKPSVVFSRDNLMRAGYEDDRIVSSRTIDSHMKNLRSKLSQFNETQSILHSVYGIGYKIE